MPTLAYRDNSLPSSLQPLDVTIETADQTKLAGIYYPSSKYFSAVLICSATGIGQRFYADFARWLNTQGFAVLTFDYRGIGKSLFGEHVKYSLAKKHEWGELDMTAALTYLSKRHPGIPLHIVGHDAAGILMGLMPNHAQISGAVSIGGSAFYVPEMAAITRLIANLFFKFYVPFCLSQFGYVPLKFFGWGEDIPSGVAIQWARWSLQAGHIRNSFGAEIKRHFYREFHSPILVLYTADGLITDQTSIEDLTDLYRSAAINCKEIGHINFFQQKDTNLWRMISDWMKAPGRQTIRTLALKMPPHMVAAVPRPSRPDRSKAYTCTRLSAQQSKFIGATKKKVKV